MALTKGKAMSRSGRTPSLCGPQTWEPIALTRITSLDAAELDSFMIRARSLADQWLS